MGRASNQGGMDGDHDGENRSRAGTESGHESSRGVKGPGSQEGVLEDEIIAHWTGLRNTW